jgi:hypothetical protein
VDDSGLVCRFERLGDLPRNGQSLVDRIASEPRGSGRTRAGHLRQITALDQFHHQRGRVGGAFHAVDGRDVRMVERGQHLGFALKAHQPIGIRGHRLRQDLDGDLTFQAGVARTIDRAHAAFAKFGDDVIPAKAGPWFQTHRGGAIIDSWWCAIFHSLPARVKI